MYYDIIVAKNSDGLIGYNGNLVYRIKKDMEYFKKITKKKNNIDKKNAVVMGRKTWESIPSNFRPLEDRVNCILTRDKSYIAKINSLNNDDIICSTRFEKLIENLWKNDYIENIFIIGGYEIYKRAVDFGHVRYMYVTEINHSIPSSDINTEHGVYFPLCDMSKFSLFTEKINTGNVKIMLQSSINDFISGEIKSKKIKVDKEINYSFTVYRNNELEEIETEVLSSSSSNSSPSSLKHNIKSEVMEALKENNFLNEKNDESSTFENRNIEEEQYLNLLKETLENGDVRKTRNSITRSIFGMRMEFDLDNNTIPLLTTKRVAWKTAIKELIWFISGSTSNKELQKQNVHIWDGNSSREYLDSIGLKNREEGDLGPVYGFQWRHTGAKYTTFNDNYEGKGIDQLQNCIDLIKSNPTSRRIIMNSWIPEYIDEMALPPCHILCQWYVSSDNKLSLQMYQRSGDSFLGVPFNIFSYSMLIYMVAHITGKKPGKLIHIIGDFHIYDNHIEQVKEQISRKPYSFPTLKIKRSVNNINDFKLNDFEIENYNCHSQIKAEMVA